MTAPEKPVDQWRLFQRLRSLCSLSPGSWLPTLPTLPTSWCVRHFVTYATKSLRIEPDASPANNTRGVRQAKPRVSTRFLLHHPNDILRFVSRSVMFITSYCRTA
ncbi:hypothetical protein RR42_s1108 [Cupriavidus basilensis]|uniref:Uncharacterized protein n=1 Tax=Cupriavidus basilensis TaxID=68895 RepID=A0A0C4YB01_9BURK|nr:hypothetical protein RR42_s1108 [Cupriavidus basilensis]